MKKSAAASSTNSVTASTLNKQETNISDQEMAKSLKRPRPPQDTGTGGRTSQDRL